MAVERQMSAEESLARVQFLFDKLQWEKSDWVLAAEAMTHFASYKTDCLRMIEPNMKRMFDYLSDYASIKIRNQDAYIFQPDKIKQILFEDLAFGTHSRERKEFADRLLDSVYCTQRCLFGAFKIIHFQQKGVSQLKEKTKKLQHNLDKLQEEKFSVENETLALKQKIVFLEKELANKIALPATEKPVEEKTKEQQLERLAEILWRIQQKRETKKPIVQEKGGEELTDTPLPSAPTEKAEEESKFDKESDFSDFEEIENEEKTE